jgi:hypothetical protein
MDDPHMKATVAMPSVGKTILVVGFTPARSVGCESALKDRNDDSVEEIGREIRSLELPV